MQVSHLHAVLASCARCMLSHLQCSSQSPCIFPMVPKPRLALLCVDKAILVHISLHLQGLRERNWTSRHFRESSEPWKIEIYEDSGRLLAPSWSGFRATVTQADGSMRWVDMPTAGAESYTEVSQPS